MALERTASRFLVPIGALLALGVAVGVWVVPSSVLDPKPPDVGEGGGEVPPAPEAPRQTAPGEKRWMEAAAELESLREPGPKEDKPDKPSKTDDQTKNGDGETTTPPPPTPPFQLDWHYEGMVEQPSGAAALIRIGAVQRFVFEGAELTREDDPTIPVQATAILEKVERDQITVRIDDATQVIERTDVAAPARAPGRSPPRPRRRS